MAINFIPNDPNVANPGMISVAPTPDSAAALSFQVQGLPAEAEYQPDTLGFICWQAREAALRALRTFESIHGKLTEWGGSQKTALPLIPSAGQDINAYYGRGGLSFYEAAVGQKIVYSGASTDVVAHETGHAILDSLRPDLWGVHMMEVSAFHEGFGDCIAIMTALSDGDMRQRLLAQDPTLRNGNFVESIAEALAAAIGVAVSPNHNAAQPRRALNTFKWQFPELLPEDGKPGVLINEMHSLGQVISGCFYDLIVEIFQSSGQNPTESDLWAACRAATKLLAEGVLKAPIRPRFFQAVGRAMLLADQDVFESRNQAHILKAFDNHGIAVGGAAAFLAPRQALEARAPRRRGRTASMMLSPAAKRSLRMALEVDDAAKLQVRSLHFAGRNVAEAAASRSVDLTGIHAKLDGAKAYAPQPALVGEVAGATAMLGAVDTVPMLSNEVRSFVHTLVRQGAIRFEPTSPSGARSRTTGTGFVVSDRLKTHALVLRKGEQVLERLGFACTCGLRPLRRTVAPRPISCEV